MLLERKLSRSRSQWERNEEAAGAGRGRAEAGSDEVAGETAVTTVQPETGEVNL
jgi:hypothetical protein